MSYLFRAMMTAAFKNMSGKKQTVWNGNPKISHKNSHNFDSLAPIECNILNILGIHLNTKISKIKRKRK